MRQPEKACAWLNARILRTQLTPERNRTIEAERWTCGQVSRLLSINSSQMALPDPVYVANPLDKCGFAQNVHGTLNHGKYGGSEVTYDGQADIVSGIGVVLLDNWEGT
eukprot:gene18410-biopygen9952